MQISPFAGAALTVKQNLKAQYLSCLSSVSETAPTLRQVIRDLLAIGIHWSELIRWAREAGHEDKAVRKLLSQILLELGIRRRRRGAGPPTPLEAQLIKADVREKYGSQATKFLLAAYRASRNEDALAQAQNQIPYPAAG